MEENGSRIMYGWGTWLISKVVHPFAVVVTPLLTLFFIVYFLGEAFSKGLDKGLRSFSAALIPPVICTFIVVFRPFIPAPLWEQADPQPPAQ